MTDHPQPTINSDTIRSGNRPILTTTDTIPGYRIVEHRGLARGNTIRSRHIGNDIIALLKTLVGGEIGEYTKMMAEAREQALDRMMADAVAAGANGVIGVRITTAMVMQGSAEILAYGTAVVLEATSS